MVQWKRGLLQNKLIKFPKLFGQNILKHVWGGFVNPFDEIIFWGLFFQLMGPHFSSHFRSCPPDGAIKSNPGFTQDICTKKDDENLDDQEDP